MCPPFCHILKNRVVRKLYKLDVIVVKKLIL